VKACATKNVWFQKISIPHPWKGKEILRGGGCHRPRNFRRRGGGCCFDEFFFQAGLNFLTAVRNVSLFALSFLSHERKKINLANLKHKMNIFVSVRLDILSLQESAISRVAASDGSACCEK